MVSSHCDTKSPRCSWLWRGLTMGIACTSGAVGAAAKPNGDVFEAAGGRTHKHAARVPRRLLQQDSLPTQQTSAQAPSGRTPKVALAFLSMGAFPQEESWRCWFQAAHNQVPLAPLQQAGCPRELVAEAVAAMPTSASDSDPIADQPLFSVYVHVPQGASYASDSMFAPYVIDSHFETQWGAHSITDAMRAVLAEGLKDERNQVFITVSDDSTPLHPPMVIYQSSLHFPVSRINACLGGERTLDRWSEVMETDALQPVRLEDWRKSSQWFQIKRHHAAAMVADEAIDHTFRTYCGQDAQSGPCATDEHYPATVLNMMGHRFETDCQGWVMATDWRDGGAHPYTFQEYDITSDLLDGLAAPQGCYPVLAQQLASYGFVQTGSDIEVAHAACQAAPPWSSYLLGSSCPLVARKFAKSSDPHVARWSRNAMRRYNDRATAAAQEPMRSAIFANITKIDDAMRADFFPEFGCTASKRDYAWPSGVFMDFACPTGQVGDAEMIEALRCYVDRPLCEGVITEKRHLFEVDDAFEDTLAGGSAMSDGVQLLRSLRESAKPELHGNVAQQVLDVLRQSTLSLPFYLQDLEVLKVEQQATLLGVLWFASSTPSGERDESLVYFSDLLSNMTRNPAALEMALEGAIRNTLPLFALPPEQLPPFDAALRLGEAVARSVADVTLENLEAARGALMKHARVVHHRLEPVVTDIGRRLQGADNLHPDIAWLTSRADGFGMLAAVMVAYAQGEETRESTARLESLKMAAETLQPSEAHMRAARDLTTLVSIARALAAAPPAIVP